MKLLIRLGYLIEEEEITYMARIDSIDPDDVLTPLQAASSTYRIAMGPRAGCAVMPINAVRLNNCAATSRARPSPMSA